MKEKNKRIIIVISVITVVALVLLGFLVYRGITISKHEKLIETIGVKDVQKINYELPKFTIVVDGIYDNTITSADIKNLDVYKIKAVMNDGIYKDDYDFVGVRVLDVLKLTKMEGFNSLTFKSSGKLQVTYDKGEITDNMYFVFEVDGYKYDASEPVALVNPDVNARYSISDIVKLTFD